MAMAAPSRGMVILTGLTKGDLAEQSALHQIAVDRRGFVARPATSRLPVISASRMAAARMA